MNTHKIPYSQTPNHFDAESMSLREAAQWLGVTDGGLRGAVRRGKLKASKDSDGLTVVSTADLGSMLLYGFSVQIKTETQRQALEDFFWVSVR